MTHADYSRRKALKGIARARVLMAVWPPLLLLCIPGALLVHTLTFVGVFLGALMIGIGALDIKGRAKDFKYLDKFGYVNQRIADYYGQSFCGRNVICTVDPVWRYYYRTRGYRIYHVFPVGFPSVLAKPRFWFNLFNGHRV